jgi:hypothetical protein
VTVIWLIVWFIADRTGGHEPLLLDPVNIWTGTLIAAIALDLGSHHTPISSRWRGGRE